MGDHPVLFIPGPTEVEPELRAILAQPLCGHREARFVAVVQQVCRGLRDLWLTAQHAAFESCPATALMEAAIRNGVPAGGRVLHLVCGAFGERWQKIAAATGRTTADLTVPAGTAHDPARLRDRLRQGPAFDAVAITHNETSTGVLEPLRELAAVVHQEQPQALLLVDAVTSVAGAELRFDDWGLDLAFAGTQKCLALPPGLCTYAVSKRFLQRASQVADRGFLLDLVQAVPETEAGRTLATPCVPLVFALQAQLQRVAGEGLAARWRRHQALRDQVLGWTRGAGLAPFVADPAHRSPTVTAIDARGHDVAALAARAAAAGFLIDQGYGAWKGKVFRIGHLGDHGPDRVAALLTALGTPPLPRPAGPS